jgi:hypothetical protein
MVLGFSIWGEGAYEGTVHVEGVLLDAGDALGEPALRVVAAAVGHLVDSRRWIWPTAFILLGILSLVALPAWVWLGAGLLDAVVRPGLHIVSICLT